jgi:hypothetical protein
VDRLIEALPRKLLGLPGARAEPGAPQQALGLLDSESATVDRDYPPPAASTRALAPAPAAPGGVRLGGCGGAHLLN